MRSLEQALKALPYGGGHPTKTARRLVAHPTLGRHLKRDSRGRLAVDTVKGKCEERLDGKYVVLITEPGRDQIIPARLFDYPPGGRPIFSFGDSSEVEALPRDTGTRH